MLVASAAPAPGVAPDSIILGQPAVFSGASAGLGVELWRGMQARLSEINDAGGIRGRRVDLTLCDDHYDPESSAKCAIDLITKRNVFVLTGTVGTPTIMRILPLLRVWSKDDVMIFGNFTGAKPQRSMPAAPYVFNVRASYEEETATHVRVCLAAGRTTIGTFVQNDAYGKDGEEGVRGALKETGATIAMATYYERGASADADMSRHVELLRQAGVNCVSTTGSYQAVAAFVRAARAVKWNVPIFAVSFTGADQLLAQLAGKVDTTRLVMTQVVPHFDDTQWPLVREYRAAMDKYRPSAPNGVGDGSYSASAPYSFGSLEGYLNTKLLGIVIAKAGADLTRASVRQAAESLRNVDVGLEKNTVTFGVVTGPDSVGNHQALHKVWLTMTRGDKWVTIDDIAAIAKHLASD